MAHSSRFLRAGAGSVLLKLSHIILTLVLSILLARALGPEGYGIYSYNYALIMLLAIPAMFGLPNLVIRETAKAQVNAQWGLMRGVWRWAALVSIGVGLVLATIAGGAAAIFRDAFTSTQLAAFAWGLLLIPLVALGNLRGAALRGLHKIIQGQLPEFVIRPAILLLLLVIALLETGYELTPNRAMAFHVAAALIAFGVGAWMLYINRPPELKGRSSRIEYDSAEWIKSTLPLAFVAGMQMINKHADILILGIFTTGEQVGIYRVVVQGAILVAFGLTAINMVVAPRFARLYSEGDHERLQRLVTLSSRVILLITFVPSALLLFWGEHLLNLVFGAEYTQGYAALVILALGQIGNAAFGSVAFLLNMTGHERDAARGVAIAAILNVALNIACVPFFGMEGAALATALSMIVWNLLLWKMVKERLGVNSTAFPIGSFQ